MKVQSLTRGGPYPAARLESSRGDSIKIRKSAEGIFVQVCKLVRSFTLPLVAPCWHHVTNPILKMSQVARPDRRHERRKVMKTQFRQTYDDATTRTTKRDLSGEQRTESARVRSGCVNGICDKDGERPSNRVSHGGGGRTPKQVL